MEPSLPVKASLLVVMADYRIELVIKQVKKGLPGIICWQHGNLLYQSRLPSLWLWLIIE